MVVRRTLLVFLVVFVAAFVVLHPALGAGGGSQLGGGEPATPPHATQAHGCASVDPSGTAVVLSAAAFALRSSRRPSPGRLLDQTHPSPDPEPPRLPAGR